MTHYLLNINTNFYHDKLYLLFVHQYEFFQYFYYHLNEFFDQIFDFLFYYRGPKANREFIDSDTALSWGLINRVSPLEKLDKELQKLVNVILSKPNIAVKTGKKMFYKQLERNMEDAYAYASRIMACNMMEEDVNERVKSFIKK